MSPRRLGNSRGLCPVQFGIATAASMAVFSAPGRAQQGPTQVEVAAVVETEIAPTLELVGSVRPRLRSLVAAEVSGLVAELPVDEGDRIHKGDMICKLRDEVRRFTHAQAVAEQARLSAAHAEALANLEMAAFDKRWMTDLWEKQQCSEKEYSDAVNGYAGAQQRVNAAQLAMSSQKADVERLAYELARTRIEAPFDGVIISKKTEVGAWIDQGGAVLELLDLSTVRARVLAPESIVAHCTVGTDVIVRVDALDRSVTAEIARVIPDADPQARTFPVEIDIANEDGDLKPGMLIRAAMPSGPRRTERIVPKDAVVARGPVQMVFVVRTGEQGAMAVPMPVQVVAEIRDQLAVRAEGLAKDDQVVVRGNEYMFGPTPVRAVPSQPRTAGENSTGADAAESTRAGT